MDNAVPYHKERHFFIKLWYISMKIDLKNMQSLALRIKRK